MQNNAGRTYVIFGTNTLSSAPGSVAELAMRQNYPNPFNPSTSIPYSVAENALVRMDIFDVTGKFVSTLVDIELNPGEYVAHWNGLDHGGEEVASGVYFCKLTANEQSITMKIVLVR